MKIKVGVISLGCAKNLVDTEVMLGCISDKCEFVSNPESASVLIINTCCFIDDAKQESIDTILEFAELKKKGKLKYIIVTGCLVQRYKNELIDLLPEVDYFAGVAAYKELSGILDKVYQGIRGCDCPLIEIGDGVLPRMITTLKPTAYVKIAEGCDNHCSYCIIPEIRGNYISRSIEDILTEIMLLVQNGYTEIILIAQDTTLYGNDIYGNPVLPQLLEKAASTPGLIWLRVLYCYPSLISDDLLAVIADNDRIVNYIDMPVQHFSNNVLKDMNRRYSYENINHLVRRIRSYSSDFIIRTTMITGFPGETEEDINICVDALKELKFDRVGIFPYSQEDGTVAFEMPYQITEDDRLKRADYLMSIQKEISFNKNKERIGQIYKVLIEGYDCDSDLYYGRSYAEAPDCDGKIFVECMNDMQIGAYYNVEIVYVDEYDLKGVVKNECS